jgi:hypothetical protein
MAGTGMHTEILLGKRSGKRLQRRSRSRWENNVKTNEKVVRMESGGTGSGTSPMAGFGISGI